MISLSPRDPWWFTPDSENDEKKPGRFQIRPLTEAEEIKLSEVLPQNEGEESSVVSGIRFNKLCCKLGVCGFENITDGDGKPVKWEADEDGYMTDKLVNALPRHLRGVLGTVVYNGAKLTEGEVKNLELRATGSQEK